MGATPTTVEVACIDCDTTWLYQHRTGPLPKRCATCKREHTRRLRAGYRPPDAAPISAYLAASAAKYRAAIEHAIGALRTGRIREALDVLEDARP